MMMNPIIVKELRSRMRGGRAFIILTIMLLALTGMMYLSYRVTLSLSSYSAIVSPQIGQSLFLLLALMEMLVICFITPALTAGAISGEREKLTYEMLLTTPLSPASILWGKLVSALSYVFLLIFAAIPLASLVFIFGGVSPWAMASALLMLLSVAVMLGVVGIFMSAWLGRSTRATIMSYLFVLLLIVLPIVAYIATGIIQQDVPPRLILFANPLSALFAAITPAAFNTNSGPDLWTGIAIALSGNIELFNENMPNPPRPLHHFSLPLYATITLLLYLLATRYVMPTQRWRLRGRGVLVSLLLLVLVGAATALGFWYTADDYEGSTSRPTPIPVERAIEPVQEEFGPGPFPTATPEPAATPAE